MRSHREPIVVFGSIFVVLGDLVSLNSTTGYWECPRQLFGKPSNQVILCFRMCIWLSMLVCTLCFYKKMKSYFKIYSIMWFQIVSGNDTISKCCIDCFSLVILLWRHYLLISWLLAYSVVCIYKGWASI